MTKQEANKLKEELVGYGFKEDKINIKYTTTRVSYGNPIFLEVAYEYEIDFPMMETSSVPMKITRNSVSKR